MHGSATPLTQHTQSLAAHQTSCACRLEPPTTAAAAATVVLSRRKPSTPHPAPLAAAHSPDLICSQVVAIKESDNVLPHKALPHIKEVCGVLAGLALVRLRSDAAIPAAGAERGVGESSLVGERWSGNGRGWGVGRAICARRGSQCLCSGQAVHAMGPKARNQASKAGLGQGACGRTLTGWRPRRPANL